MFEEQDHAFFVNSSDFVLVMSLLYSLDIDEDAISGVGIHEHWQALDINQEIGFVPHYNENRAEITSEL